MINSVIQLNLNCFKIIINKNKIIKKISKPIVNQLFKKRMKYFLDLK